MLFFFPYTYCKTRNWKSWKRSIVFCTKGLYWVCFDLKMVPWK